MAERIVVVEGVPASAGGAPGSVACIEAADRMVSVNANRGVVVVIRDAHDEGRSALVNVPPAEVHRADGRHGAMRVPAGRSHIVITHRPHRLGLGI